MKKSVSKTKPPAPESVEGYEAVRASLVTLLESARRFSARSVNTIMTATYWEIGRRIVGHEQGGKRKAEYGETLLKSLAVDLTARFGRGGWSGQPQSHAEVFPHLARGKHFSDGV